MFGGKAVSSFVRAQVLTLDGGGFSKAQISKQFNIFCCCLQKTTNKYENLGTYEDLKLSESTKKLDEWGFWHLKRLVEGDVRLSATKILSNMNASLPKSVKTQTVRTCLKELGFEYVVKEKKQWLGIQQQQQRVCLVCKVHELDF